MTPVARRLQPFGVTIFTEMSALAAEVGAINLGQGFPNWDGADLAKRAAIASMATGNDQYPPSHGIPELRRAIARRYGPLLGRSIDPEGEVTVTTGCTEALAAAMLGLVEPGDEVVVIEPFYDAYPADLALAGAIPRFVTLRPPEFALDPDELAAAFSPRTKAILVNTPHNPTGRVLTADELDAIARLCVEHDTIAITDEVYEEMVFERPHLRLARREGMWERTLTLSSLGKTFSLTGWKVGWAIGPRRPHQSREGSTPISHLHHPDTGAARRGGRVRRSGLVLRRDEGELPGETRPSGGRAERGGVRGLPHRGHLLHDGGVRGAVRCRRPRVLPADGGAGRRGRHPPERLLPRPDRRLRAGQVRLLQGRGDADRGNRAAGQALGRLITAGR